MDDQTKEPKVISRRQFVGGVAAASGVLKSCERAAMKVFLSSSRFRNR